MEFLALGLVGISLFYAGILLLAARFLPKTDDKKKNRPKSFYQKFSKRLFPSSRADQEAAA